MNPENTLCLVVDVQERLLPVLHGADEMVGRCRVLLQGMRALGVPLLATEQYPKGLGKTVPAVQLLLDGAPVFEKTLFRLPAAGRGNSEAETDCECGVGRRGDAYLHAANGIGFARGGAGSVCAVRLYGLAPSRQ